MLTFLSKANKCCEKNKKNNSKNVKKKNQKLPKIVKVAKNLISCRKVAEQLAAKPSTYMNTRRNFNIQFILSHGYGFNGYLHLLDNMLEEMLQRNNFKQAHPTMQNVL